jgi:hypothetical protein
MKTISVCWLACAVIACGSDLPDGSQIDKLRLLALRADQPYVHPGETVELQLLAADAGQRPLQFALSTCTNPAGSSVAGCLADLDHPFEALSLDAGRFSLEIPDDALAKLSDTARLSALIGAVLVACPGQIDSGKTSGVPIVCRDSEGARLPIEQFEVGIKRLFLRETERNQNPEITRISWDGDDWPEAFVPEVRACAARDTLDIEDCSEELRHLIRVETAAADSGVDENGTDYREQQVVQFYTSAGVFERAVRIAEEPDNHWSALGSDTEAKLWFVVRDDRGGVSWAERRVRVR